MQNFKSILLLSLILVSLPTFSNAQDRKYKIKWTVAHGPYRLVQKATDQFIQNVQKRTNGAVEIQLQKNEESPYFILQNKNKEALKELILGKIQMAQIYTSNLANYYPDMDILHLPFLFKNDEHVFKVLDGEIGQQLTRGLLESTGNIRNLAYTYCGGFYMIATRNTELNTADDFAKLTLVYPSSRVTKEAYNALKIKTYASNFSESLKKVRSKSVNGFESTFPRFANSGELGTVKVVNLTGMNVLMSGIIINDEFFRRLPAEYQKIISEEAMSAALVERAESIRISNEIKAQSAKLDFKIVQLPREEVERAQKMVEPVYTKYGPLFGEDKIKKIIDAAK